MTELIDRALLFGNPDRATVRVSPDGRWLSWLAPEEGVLNVWVAPLGQPDEARAVTHDRGRGIQSYGWAPSSERLVALQDRDGDENWRLFSIDPATEQAIDLTPLEGVQAQLVGASPRHPHLVAVGLNDRNPQLHDVYHIDVRTGERTLVLENPGLVGIQVDWELQPAVGVQPRADGGLEVLRHQNSAWAPIGSVSQADSLTTAPIRGTADGTTWYWLDSRDRNTGALLAENVATGAFEVLAEDARADIDDLTIHPATGRVQAAFSTYGERTSHVVDPEIAPHLEVLERAHHAPVDIVSRSHDDSVWVVAWTPEDGPIAYGLYRTATREVKELFLSRTALAGKPLARRRPVMIPSRDGLELVSYLSLPPWLDRDGSLEAPIPMVLFVHGGPWARDAPGYEPHHQLLANRGYAVLSVNFRGSTGFGKGFLNAGDRQWAEAMHHDLLDAVDWAVAQGIAERDKVAIMGGSYGGYATLVGLTFTPEVFACGVDIVGPSNLITLLESIPPYWAPMKAQFVTRMGDDGTDEGRADLWARSPLSKVEAIVRPLLIAQGANDPRVKQAESDQIVHAMKERGIPVQYALFPDEGHGFARPENRLAFLALVESFLAEHLGGRAQPEGDHLEASSLVLS